MPIEAWMLALGSASLFGLGLVVTQFGLRDMTPALGATFSMPMAALVFWADNLELTPLSVSCRV